MFHWICPECGLECPPSSRGCPECDRQVATAAVATEVARTAVAHASAVEAVRAEAAVLLEATAPVALAPVAMPAGIPLSDKIVEMRESMMDSVVAGVPVDEIDAADSASESEIASVMEVLAQEVLEAPVAVEPVTMPALAELSTYAVEPVHAVVTEAMQPPPVVVAAAAAAAAAAEAAESVAEAAADLAERQPVAEITPVAAEQVELSGAEEETSAVEIATRAADVEASAAAQAVPVAEIEAVPLSDLNEEAVPGGPPPLPNEIAEPLELSVLEQVIDAAAAREAALETEFRALFAAGNVQAQCAQTLIAEPHAYLPLAAPGSVEEVPSDTRVDAEGPAEPLAAAAPAEPVVAAVLADGSPQSSDHVDEPVIAAAAEVLAPVAGEPAAEALLASDLDVAPAEAVVQQTDDVVYEDVEGRADLQLAFELLATDVVTAVAVEEPVVARATSIEPAVEAVAEPVTASENPEAEAEELPVAVSEAESEVEVVAEAAAEPALEAAAGVATEVSEEAAAVIEAPVPVEAASVEATPDEPHVEYAVLNGGNGSILSLVEAVGTETVAPEPAPAPAPESASTAADAQVEVHAMANEAHALANNETMRIPMALLPATVLSANASGLNSVATSSHGTVSLDRPYTLHRMDGGTPAESFERPRTLRRESGDESGGDSNGNSDRPRTLRREGSDSSGDVPESHTPHALFEQPQFETPNFVEPPFIDMTPRQIFPEPQSGAQHDRGAAELAGLLGLSPHELEPSLGPEPPLTGLRSTAHATLISIAAARPPKNIAALDSGPRTTLPGPALIPELVRRSGVTVIGDGGRKARGTPAGGGGWMASLLVTFLVFGTGIAALVYFGQLDVAALLRGETSSSEGPAPSSKTANGKTARPLVDGSETAPAPAAGQALAKYIEITGVRIVVDSSRKPEVHYLVVNHSAAEIADVSVRATVRSIRRAGSAPLTSFSFRVPNLGPYEAKEMMVPIEKLARGFEVPDWQNLKTDFQILGQ